MWRTLALASAFFPGLFALCIRLLRCAAPGWSLKDRILLSGRYGRGRREMTRTRHRYPSRRAGTGSRGDPGGPRARAPAAGSLEPRPAALRGPDPRQGRAQAPRGEQAGAPSQSRDAPVQLPFPRGTGQGYRLSHGSGRDESWQQPPAVSPGDSAWRSHPNRVPRRLGTGPQLLAVTRLSGCARSRRPSANSSPGATAPRPPPLLLGPSGAKFGVTPFLSLGFRLVSMVQATMATVSGITVVLNCKNVVYDR